MRTNFHPNQITTFLRYRIFLRYTILLKLRKKKFFALDKLDSKLIRLLSNKRGGYFVEIGGFDGVTYSMTKHLESYLGWTGLLIEPIKEKYEFCRMNRRKTTKVLNVACVPFEFPEEDVEIMELGPMSVIETLDHRVGNFDKHLLAAENHLGRKGKPLRTPTMTLTDALQKAKSPREIDILILDVEGAEIEVLRGLDFEEFSFKNILIESRDDEFTISFLRGKGYRFVNKISHADLYFEREIDSTLGHL